MTILETIAMFRDKIRELPGPELNLWAITPESKQVITDIYIRLYHKRPRGCDSCWMDAVIEIGTLDDKKIMKRLENQFAVIAGKLLHDRRPDFRPEEGSRMLSNANCTNELALYHLATNPGCEAWFWQMPEDWQELVDQKRAELKAAGYWEETAVKESPVILSPVEAEIDVVKEIQIATDPETLDNTVFIEPNPEKNLEEIIKKAPPRPKRKYTRRR
jgi:hypothetical protein